jgi:hypothetical protein
MQAFCDKIGNWCNETVSWTPGDNEMFVAEPYPETLFGVSSVASKKKASVASSSSESSSFASPAPYVPAAESFAASTEPRRVRLRDRLLGR